MHRNSVLLHFGKYGISAYGFSDTGKDAAFLRLFSDIDRIGYYAYINQEEDPGQYTYLLMGREGDANAARALINLRASYEYEGFEVLPLN